MEKRIILCSFLAVLLGVSLIILPTFLVQTSARGKITALSKSSETQEISKSGKSFSTGTYETESISILQKLFFIFFIPLTLAYLVFRLVRNKYAL